MKQYKTDPALANCLPTLDLTKYNEIKADIAVNGYNKAFPLIIWEGHDTIVDGHHRYRMCQELAGDHTPIVVEQHFDTIEDAVIFALEHQENSRDLTKSQKATIGTKLRLLQVRVEARKREYAGTLASTEARVGKSAAIIAKEINVCGTTVERVIAVIDAGIPELEQMLIQGEITARAGHDFVRNTSADNRMAVVNRGPGAVKEFVNQIRGHLREEEKDRKFQEERAEIKQDVQEYHAVQKEKFGGATYACGLSSVFELWCNSCKCAFDIFKPFEATCCPACAGNDIEKRDEMWYPGMKVD